MQKTRLVCMVALALTASAFAKSHLLGVKVEITNPTGQELHAENVVIPIADLRKVAPDLRAGSLIVTATDAATEGDDAVQLETEELPSQVDDLDGDSKAEELAFQIDLKPHQTRIVTVTYGEPNRVFHLRAEYPNRTHAMFASKFEGLGWESERAAWRLYFDARNAIDLYGKKRATLLLQRFATPEYDYHAENPDGRDIFKVGNSIGIGAVAAWKDGTLIKASDVTARRWRVISTGPVRAIVEVTYGGWMIGGKRVDVTSRITQWAGERGFFQTITSHDAEGVVFATGLPIKPNVATFRSQADDGSNWLATWGEQVVLPGATATEETPGMNMGLMIVMHPTVDPTEAKDKNDHLLTFPLHNGSATWYVAAAWDHELTNNQIAFAAPSEVGARATRVVASDAITNRDEFLAAVRQQAQRMRAPAIMKILSGTAKPQPGPSDSRYSSTQKTYAQAIDLLRQQIDRDAQHWAPILSSTGGAGLTTNHGAGFFNDGNNKTGEWEAREGFFWTGGFWTGELWKMYARTKDDKYRQWGEVWTNALVGQETKQNHDVGFLYYYSSALGFEVTQNAKLKESALRAAERLATLYNPKTNLIAAWEPGGDDTIVDTMANLQILWWAGKQTSDPRWREIGLHHALRTAEWLLRDDGSVAQSVHYNPGDNRQRMELRGGGTNIHVEAPNDVAPGQKIFTHTHQGYSAQTAWSRGAAWALYGFATAYRETRDLRMLATAEKVAAYVLNELPEDGVPWYDFYDEGVHFRNRDTSAAALIAGGLLRLSDLVSDKDRARSYRAESERITQSLIDHYLTPVSQNDTTPGGVLRHGCGTRPKDGMLIYGQYYLLETLMALEERGSAVAEMNNW
jgi:unsaturated chondroitin disaccharide hydrolase